MSAHCCSQDQKSKEQVFDPQWRRALWIALLVNAAMFILELTAGGLADSRALQADAIDFFADAANYGITLGVAGLALAWRARAALFKGVTLLALGGFVAVATVSAGLTGSAPNHSTMGVVGGMALLANLAVAIMLYRWRSGDANMQSVWICTRNDVIANIAVLSAALGVFGTGTRWPDLAVALIMAILSLTGGWRIIRLALLEIRASTENRELAPAPPQTTLNLDLQL